MPNYLKRGNPALSRGWESIEESDYTVIVISRNYGCEITKKNTSFKGKKETLPRRRGRVFSFSAAVLAAIVA
jgi:hypothetical protein